MCDVGPSQSHAGLPLADAKRLKYYLHFKHPASGQEKVDSC